MSCICLAMPILGSKPKSKETENVHEIAVKSESILVSSIILF